MKGNSTEGIGNIIKYIVNKLTIKGFSVGCYCVDNCINIYVQRGDYCLTRIISLATLDLVENKQYCIDYFISNTIKQFNQVNL